MRFSAIFGFQQSMHHLCYTRSAFQVSRRENAAKVANPAVTGAVLDNDTGALDGYL